MALDLDTVKQAMEEYFVSEQYIKDLAKCEHRQTLNKRNIEYLHQLSAEERCNLINKVLNKYNSDEYRARELKLGHYEPRTYLYEIIFDYAVKYGIPSLYNMNGYFPEDQYDIDGKFVILQIYGQGSVIHITPIGENEVIPHNLQNIEVTIFDSDNKKVITTDNALIFNDICIQIKNKKLNGYYIMFEGKKYEIKSNGKLNNRYPNGLFDIETKQLRQLVLNEK